MRGACVMYTPRKIGVPCARHGCVLELEAALPDAGRYAKLRSAKYLYHSGRPDSNRRRPAWEAGILPLNYARNLLSNRHLWIQDHSAKLPFFSHI